MNRKLFPVIGMALLAGIACGGAQGGSAPAPGSGAGDSSLTVHVSDFKIEPPSVTVQSGASITVKNDGPTPHNLTIRDSSGKVVAASPTLKPGESAPLKISIPAGTYTDFCSLPGHESLGMKATFTVS